MNSNKQNYPSSLNTLSTCSSLEDDRASITTTESESNKERIQKSRCRSEKKRRDKLNLFIRDLQMMLSPSCTKRLDKSTILKMTVDYLKMHNDLTVNINGEGKLSKSFFLPCEELGQLMLEISNGFIIIINEDAKFVYVAEIVEKLLGVKASDFTDKTIHAIVHKDDQHKLADELLSGVLKEDASVYGGCSSDMDILGGTPLNNHNVALDFRLLVEKEKFEPEYRCLNCTGKWYSFKNQGGSPYGDKLLVLLACLKNSGVREIINDSNTTICFKSKHSLDGKFLFADTDCPSVTGYLPYELLGKSIYLFVHDDDLMELCKLHEKITKKMTQDIMTAYVRFRSKGEEWLLFKTEFRLVMKASILHPDHIAIKFTLANAKETHEFRRFIKRKEFRIEDYLPDILKTPEETSNTNKDASSVNNENSEELASSLQNNSLTTDLVITTKTEVIEPSPNLQSSCLSTELLSQTHPRTFIQPKPNMQNSSFTGNLVTQVHQSVVMTASSITSTTEPSPDMYPSSSLQETASTTSNPISPTQSLTTLPKQEMASPGNLVPTEEKTEEDTEKDKQRFFEAQQHLHDQLKLKHEKLSQSHEKQTEQLENIGAVMAEYQFFMQAPSFKSHYQQQVEMYEYFKYMLKKQHRKQEYLFKLLKAKVKELQIKQRAMKLREMASRQQKTLAKMKENSDKQKKSLSNAQSLSTAQSFDTSDSSVPARSWTPSYQNPYKFSLANNSPVTPSLPLRSNPMLASTSRPNQSSFTNSPPPSKPIDSQASHFPSEPSKSNESQPSNPNSLIDFNLLQSQLQQLQQIQKEHALLQRPPKQEETTTQVTQISTMSNQQNVAQTQNSKITQLDTLRQQLQQQGSSEAENQIKNQQMNNSSSQQKQQREQQQRKQQQQQQQLLYQQTKSKQAYFSTPKPVFDFNLPRTNMQMHQSQERLEQPQQQQGNTNNTTSTSESELQSMISKQILVHLQVLQKHVLNQLQSVIQNKKDTTKTDFSQILPVLQQLQQLQQSIIEQQQNQQQGVTNTNAPSNYENNQSICTQSIPHSFNNNMSSNTNLTNMLMVQSLSQQAISSEHMSQMNENSSQLAHEQEANSAFGDRNDSQRELQNIKKSFSYPEQRRKIKNPGQNQSQNDCFANLPSPELRSMMYGNNNSNNNLNNQDNNQGNDLEKDAKKLKEIEGDNLSAFQPLMENQQLLVQLQQYQRMQIFMQQQQQLQLIQSQQANNTPQSTQLRTVEQTNNVNEQLRQQELQQDKERQEQKEREEAEEEAESNDQASSLATFFDNAPNGFPVQNIADLSNWLQPENEEVLNMLLNENDFYL